ncbi:FecCD family ABC transporter permease [Streptomyces sp. bgisy100]|uniref:FecCD family ABC transporter permease n=1 Tax=Streptomyces sp. bgisy100 TaxID=3413783 RepID=UPI003D7251A9
MTGTAHRPRVLPAGHTLVRAGAASFLVHRRAARTAGALTVLLAAVCLASLCLGETTATPLGAMRVLAGLPSPDAFVVGTLRLPRLVTGLLVGVAFGLAGALVQTVARNPLASPDIIGVSQGAGALTVGALTFGVTSTVALPALSVAGGLATAALVYALTWRRGLHAGRFVLIGIGFAIALRSVTQLFLTKGEPLVAQQAQVWMTGSLDGRGRPEAAPLGCVLLLLLPAVLWAGRAQRAVALDDDTATALGTHLGRTRLGLAALGVVLASVATAAAGPVDFVALLAPQIARRAARTDRIPLVCAALTGAVIVVAADLAARTLLSPTELPVGVLTAAVGAPYLIRLILRGRTGGTS